MPEVFSDLLRKRSLQGRGQELSQNAKETRLSGDHEPVNSAGCEVVFQSVHDLAVKVFEESISSLLLGRVRVLRSEAVVGARTVFIAFDLSVS